METCPGKVTHFEDSITQAQEQPSQNSEQMDALAKQESNGRGLKSRCFSGKPLWMSPRVFFFKEYPLDYSDIVENKSLRICPNSLIFGGQFLQIL